MNFSEIGFTTARLPITSAAEMAFSRLDMATGRLTAFKFLSIIATNWSMPKRSWTAISKNFFSSAGISGSDNALLALSRSTFRWASIISLDEAAAQPVDSRFGRSEFDDIRMLLDPEPRRSGPNGIGNIRGR